MTRRVIHIRRANEYDIQSFHSLGYETRRFYSTREQPTLKQYILEWPGDGDPPALLQAPCDC